MKTKKLLFIVLLFIALIQVNTTRAAIVVSGAVVNGSYTSFSGAGGAFSIINGSVQTSKNIIITVTAGESLEDGTVALANGVWTSLKIYTSGTYSISGAATKPLLYFNGADKVTIDGRVGQTGSTIALTFENTSTSNSAGTSTIAFAGDAQTDKISYCTIKGAETLATSGVIFFSTSTSSGNTETIEYCNITGSGANRPVNAIYSAGSTTARKNTFTLDHNNIYDFLNKGIASCGINISTFSEATITNNSFYETASFAPTASAAYVIINIVNINNAAAYTITGNYIGGQAASCGSAGVPWVKTNAFDNTFTGIYMSVSTVASSIQNNTIKNITWSNSAAASWNAMYINAGSVNIGTSAGNNIGETNSTGSISVTGGVNGATVYGINIIAANGTVDFENNIIGSITTNNASANNATNLYAISKTGNGNATISNNTIGSITTANSLQTASPATDVTASQVLYGIYANAASTLIFNNNDIANLNNKGTNANFGQVVGFITKAGTNTISNNRIHDLKSANNNAVETDAASVMGIVLEAGGNVYGNTIYNLANTYSNTVAKEFGIFSNTSVAYNIYNNYVYGFTVTNPTASAGIYGLRFKGLNCNFHNNIINLGEADATRIFGMFDDMGNGDACNLYFNTVYIGGSTAGSTNSWAMYSNSTNANSSIFENNIFSNERESAGKDYAVYYMGSGSTFTMDFNDYYVSGTNGVLAYYNTTDINNLSDLQTAVGEDANSLNVDPAYANAGSAIALDYLPSYTPLTALTATGFTTDYRGFTRSLTDPVMGALEQIFVWKGATSIDWNTASNWIPSMVPIADASITFDVAPANHCTLDQDRSVNNIINHSNYHMVTNGFNLTVKGDFDFTAGAKIDASATNSTVTFANASAPQIIQAGTFYNNNVFNLTIDNNSNGVTLFGTLNILGDIMSMSGLLDVNTNNPTLGFAGTSGSQSLHPEILTDNTVYNITISNPDNVILYGDLTILGAITSTSGGLDAVSVNSPFITFKGASNQIIPNNAFAGNEIYNLTIDNPAGISVSLENNELITVTNSLTINTDAKLYVVPGAMLTVNGTTTLNGTECLVLSSDVNSTGSFIDNGFAGTGTAKVEKYLTTGRWWYIGSPVVDASGEDAFDDLSTVPSTGSRLLYYDEPDADSLAYVTVTNTDNLMPTMGYAFREYGGSPKVATYTGDLNTGTISSESLTRTAGIGIFKAGYNLVSNPYPSAIEWGSDAVPSPGLTKTNLETTIWYKIPGTFATYNAAGSGVGVNSGTQFIPAMHAFWVRVSAGQTSGGFELTNAARVHSSQTFYKIGDPTNVFRMEVARGTKIDESVVTFYPAALKTYDDYDSQKMLSDDNTYPQIFSMTTENVNVAINGQPELEAAEERIIPLGFITKVSGTFTIRATNLAQFDPSVYVFLKDLQTGTYQNLTENDTYTFTSNVANTTSRFELHFGYKVNLAMPIQLIKFEATCSNNSVNIDWSTATETNNDYFTIERSVDASNWEFVKKINGGGNSNSILNYSLTDNNPLNDISYYRLTQTDYDGKFVTFSPVTVVCSEAQLNAEVSYYPNPFTSEVIASVQNLASGNTTVKVYDIFGTEVFKRNISQEELGLKTFSLNLADLAAGIYTVELSNDNYSGITKIVKQ